MTESDRQDPSDFRDLILALRAEMESNPNELYTARQIGLAIGRSAETVRRWARNDKIPSEPYGINLDEYRFSGEVAKEILLRFPIST